MISASVSAAARVEGPWVLPSCLETSNRDWASTQSSIEGLAYDAHKPRFPSIERVVVLVWLAFKRPKAWVRLLSLFWNVEYSLSLRILFSRQWDIFYWKDSRHYVRIAPVCNTFVSSISGQCSVSLHYFYSASHHPFCVLWEFYSMPQYVLINALTLLVYFEASLCDCFPVPTDPTLVFSATYSFSYRIFMFVFSIV